MDTSIHSHSVHEPKSPPTTKAPSALQGNENTTEKTFDKETKEELPAPITAVETPQRWNRPRINASRFLVTLLGFFLMGMNDAVIGALVPYLEIYYNISYTLVSLLFLAPFVGYTTAALLNNKIHVRFGQLGIAIIAPSCKIVGYVITCIHPPYPVLPIIFVLAGFGQGLEDGAWNAWIGNMANANELLGLLHGLYGLGAAMAPLIATTMVTQRHLPWYTFYYIMISLAALELAVAVPAFWNSSGAKHRAANPRSPEDKSSRTREALTNRISWTSAIFLFGYTGCEVSLGGWLVTFMLRVRHGGAFASGMVATGFWLGITFGRMILGFVTPRFGEKLAIMVYLLLCMGLELLFWLIPSFLSSAIFVGFLGFFMGPLFPAAIVAVSKLLPRHLHVSAIAFAAAFGGGGAACFPFAVGAIAQVKGVEVLQPIILAFLAAIFLLWCTLPGGFRKQGLEMAQIERSDGRQQTEMQWFRKSAARIMRKSECP